MFTGERVELTKLGRYKREEVLGGAPIRSIRQYKWGYCLARGDFPQRRYEVHPPGKIPEIDYTHLVVRPDPVGGPLLFWGHYPMSSSAPRQLVEEGRYTEEHLEQLGFTDSRRLLQIQLMSRNYGVRMYFDSPKCTGKYERVMTATYKVPYHRRIRSLLVHAGTSLPGIY